MTLLDYFVVAPLVISGVGTIGLLIWVSYSLWK